MVSTPNDSVKPINESQPNPEPAMTRVSYFSTMSFARLARLLSENEHYRARHNECSESLLRCCSFLQFCCCSLCSMVTIMTPWMLCAAEVITMMVLYFTVVPNSVESFTGSNGLTEDHFTMRKDLKDALILSAIRVFLLSIAYGLASARCSYWPYYFTAWLTSIMLIPYAIIRIVFSSLNPLGAILALLLTLIAFSIVHVIVAHTTVKRLQRKENLGLPLFGLPWQEDDWVRSGSAESVNTNEAIAELLDADAEDIPRERLADTDSKFINCNGISVHYKEESPLEEDQMMDTSFAILLIHGYGGGVFSWRNLMKPLAETCACRVVAFDRPAFGLTDRPRIFYPDSNPYKLQSQQKLVLELCEKLGIKKVLLVAHSDGCILALMLGAELNPFNALIPQRASRTTRSVLKSGFVSGHKIPVEIDMETCSKGLLSSQKQDDKTTQETESLDSIEETSVTSKVHSGLSIVGIAFLHPNLHRDDGPSFINILRRSKIARKVLRPLLRSDIGEVSNRKSWYDASKLTKEILDLYKAPLRIRGWDSALVAYTKEKKCLTNEDVRELTNKVIGMPMMVLTGENDWIVPPEKASNLAEELHAVHKSILPGCGHLSHEEVPIPLRDNLVAFVKYMCELYEDM